MRFKDSFFVRYGFLGLHSSIKKPDFLSETRLNDCQENGIILLFYASGIHSCEEQDK